MVMERQGCCRDGYILASCLRRIGRWWYICGHQLNSFHTYAACFWSVDVGERNLAIITQTRRKGRTKQIRWNRLIKSRVDHPSIGLMQSNMARCCRGQSPATESRRIRIPKNCIGSGGGGQTAERIRNERRPDRERVNWVRPIDSRGPELPIDDDKNRIEAFSTSTSRVVYRDGSCNPHRLERGSTHAFPRPNVSDILSSRFSSNGCHSENRDSSLALPNVRSFLFSNVPQLDLNEPFCLP